MIRHGQTDFNRLGIVQGRGVDSSLNEIGKKQAENFYLRYQAVPFDKVYTSSLRRTMETVSGFIDDGTDHKALPGLDEIHWGSKEGKPFDEKDHQEYQEVTEQWSMGNTHLCIAGGESPDQVQTRQKESLESHHVKRARTDRINLYARPSD